MRIFSFCVLAAGAAILSVSALAGTAPGDVGWIVNAKACELIQQLGPDASALALRYFSTPKTYFIINAHTDPARIPANSLPTWSFTSYAQMQRAIGQIPPQIRAVVYDSEHWAFTPVNEQQDPARYYPLAAQLAHAHHLRLVATPALNLVEAIEPGFKGNVAQEFLRLGIAGAAARNADVYEIQAQGSEMNGQWFDDLVSEASAQAKSANPDVTVYAGISTNPRGQVVTVDQLFTAVQSTAGISASGYWLNIPAASPFCPSCGTPKPGLAYGLLQRMAAGR